MKFGVDLRFAHNLRFPSDANRTGQLVFSHKVTSLYDPVSGSNAGGLDLASFLLGDVSKFERFASVSQNAAESQKRFFPVCPGPIPDEQQIDGHIRHPVGGLSP